MTIQTASTSTSSDNSREHDRDGNDVGLDRFLNVVTFAARVGVLNAGLMGVFHWNVVDLLLGSNPSETASLISHNVCLAFGLMSVLVLLMISKRPMQQFSAPRALEALRTGQLEPIAEPTVARNSVIA